MFVSFVRIVFDNEVVQMKIEIYCTYEFNIFGWMWKSAEKWYHLSKIHSRLPKVAYFHFEIFPRLYCGITHIGKLHNQRQIYLYGHLTKTSFYALELFVHHAHGQLQYDANGVTTLTDAFQKTATVRFFQISVWVVTINIVIMSILVDGNSNVFSFSGCSLLA